MLSGPQVPAGREGRRAAALAAGAALLLFALFAPVRSRAGWDDTFYLLQGSSLAEDGDLDLRNDLLASGIALPDRLELLADTTPAGSLDNEFSIGPALLWLPAYGAGLPLRRQEPGKAALRWGPAQRAALHLLSLLSLLGVLFFLLRLYALAAPPGSDPGSGLLPAAALVLGTPLLVYATSDYTMSHLPGALACSLLVAAALRLERAPRPASALLAGAALGLVFLVRWQDLLFGVLLALPLGVLCRRERGRAARLAAWAGLGFLAVASLQLHAWRLERGSWLVLPQGHGFFHAAHPEVLPFLVSGRSGLLPWSPVFGLAALGLLLPWRCRLPRRWAWAALAVLAAEVYVNSAAADWWGGHSFGARRMVSCVPLLPLGLANLGARFPPRSRGSRALAALLLLGCAWGLFAATLYWHGVQDLSLVLRGAPSEPGNAAMAVAGLVSDPAAARARAGRLTLSPPADYLAAPGARPSGRGIALTWLLLAAAAAATAAALARLAPRRLLAAVLALYLALALAAHLRLALGPHPDAAERAGWRRLARQWRLPPRQYDPGEIAVPPEPGRWRRSPADAYRYVQLFLEWRAGDPARARALLQGLLARGYPAATEAQAALAEIGGEGEVVRWLPGRVFQPAGWRPALSVPLPPPAGEARAWEIAFALTPGELVTGELYDVVHLLGAGGAPLVDLALRGAGGLRLAAPGGAAERPLHLASGERCDLRLRYVPSPAAVEVTVAGAGAEPVRLAIVAGTAAGGPAEIVLGRPRERRLGSALPPGAVFADLRVTAGPPLRRAAGSTLLP